MEELSLQPYLVIFHNVLSDLEIQQLERMSRTHRKRPTVFRVQTQDRLVDFIRTGEGAWLLPKTAKDTDRLITDRIERRIGVFTGFKTSWPKLHQFLNYRFGGVFLPHWDFFNAKTGFMYGERLATLKKVEYGGATIFPNLKIAVPPIKCSALFWMSINRDNHDYEFNTLRCGCPEIAGNKFGQLYYVVC
ncbi:uncharacterized protein Dana_GF27269 [Drosophila ananassae]|uniref:Prolyl 4-hydroxylase alpha subunit domain-containing protein n=1 Tax=Drosophila ananassae TaxID=7217 RepID=A0A0P8Y2N4_DROAN|nr:uncharacterized protein Dana_GF27269 [Drosophila ananassae]